MNQWMSIAIKEAMDGINQNDGGPFGAVITRNDSIISTAHNEVLKSNDPSAHAEVMAIRNACKHLKTPHLSDCTLYTTCEPCPMCLGAIYWARIPTIYYGCTNEDAGKLGFIDQYMHDMFSIQVNDQHKLIQIDHDACMAVFDHWKKKDCHLY